MHRKDCDMTGFRKDAMATRAARKEAVLLSLVVCWFFVRSIQAAELRVWSSAVVVTDSIRLGDLCELRGLESTEEVDLLRNIVIAEAPPGGGSRIIHHHLIRAAMTAKGVNLAKTSLVGAAECEVRRPAIQQQADP